MFVDLMDDIHNTFTERFLKVQVSASRRAPAPPPMPVGRPTAAPSAPTANADPVPAPRGADDLFMGKPPRAAAPISSAPVPREPAQAVNSSLGPVGRPAAATVPEVGRNDPCPCGSGKKYKKCHGAGR